MTDTSKNVLHTYAVRKTKKQKSAFIDYIRSVANEGGYRFSTEKGAFGARNIIIGNPETAKVVYTAHYDTCARLPFPNFITPKSIFLYVLYQLFITVLLFLPGTAAGIAIAALGARLSDPAITDMLAFWVAYLWLIACMVLLYCGPANKQTVNDNTSGVITLLEIMNALSQKHRDEVAFVFFDLEEMGLFGSSGFAVRHKKAMQDKLLLNFDCVSDGEYMLLALRKRAAGYLPVLQNAFPSTDAVKVDICTRGVFYPSDQSNFPCGVGVAALKYSKVLRTLYMDRIHTKRDTVCREENIEYLTSCALRLIPLL